MISYGRGAGSVSALDATSGRLLRTTPVGGPATNAVIDDPTGRVFVATASGPGLDGRVVVLDARDGRQVGVVRVGAAPVAMAVSARAGRVFVVNTGSGTVSVLDARNGAPVRTVGVGWLPAGVAVDERAQRVFVVTPSANAVAVLDARGGRLVRRTGVGQDPMAIAVDERAGHAFVADMGDGRIGALDAASGRLVGMLRVGRGIGMVAVAARGRRLLVGDRARGVVHAFDARTLAPLYTAGVGPVLFAGAADDRRGLAIITALGATERRGLPTGRRMVVVLDALSGKVLQRRVTGPAPYFVGIDERVGRAFVVEGSDVRTDNAWAWVPGAVRRLLSLPSSTGSVSPARAIVLDDARHSAG